MNWANQPRTLNSSRKTGMVRVQNGVGSVNATQAPTIDRCVEGIKRATAQNTMNSRPRRPRNIQGALVSPPSTASNSDSSDRPAALSPSGGNRLLSIVREPAPW